MIWKMTKNDKISKICNEFDKLAAKLTLTKNANFMNLITVESQFG